MLRASPATGTSGDNNSPVTAEESNTSVPDTSKEHPTPPAEVVDWNPLSSISPSAKAGLLLNGTVSVFAVCALVSIVHSNQEFFMKAGDLDPCQIAGFIVGFFFTFWWLALQALVVRDVYVNGEEWTAASRKYLSDESRGYLSAAAEFAAILFIFFLCDRTSFIPRSKKKYDRDTFWFLWLLLCVAGLCTLRRASPPPPPKEDKDERSANNNEAGAIAVPPADPEGTPAVNEDFHIKHLQREQTEEWKGWMQIMFLWYHYFEAKELYNAIRLYIAAYVWMTGFGNFSYYYIRKDFSFSRFCGMQWRLNFLVLWVCMILNNEYMLYYICMLHTTFTVFIYIGLGVYSHINATHQGIVIKFVVLSIISFVMWDINGVFDLVWYPVTWLVQYHDPYNAKRPIMHEWFFRSHLDHYIWIIGMLCAYNHPRIDSFLQRIDTYPRQTTRMIKGGIVAACLFVGYFYVTMVFNLPKKEYNRLHPYTSFIPIVLYCVLRNTFTIFRQYHMHLFKWLGTVTLETYIAQFHVWMATTGVNGAPKRLLRVFPEGYPLLNFAVMSCFCVWASFRLFHTTNALKPFVIPSKVTEAVLRRNVTLFVGAILGTYACALVLRELVLRHITVTTA